MSRRPRSRFTRVSPANHLPYSESKANGMEMTDVTTVSRARTGDPDAFRLLVERHGQPIFRVAYRMTGNEHDADDVVQEAFLRAYREIDSFEERASLWTGLQRIAVNCARDRRRARRRMDRYCGGVP